MRGYKVFNAFCFFLAFPLISILGNNITFYLFLILIFKSRPFIGSLGKGRQLFYGLLFMVIIATLMAPYSEMARHPGLLANILLVVQYAYWIIMAIFLISMRRDLNLLELSRWLYYGTICSIIGFYLIQQNINLGPIELTFKMGRNPFIFTLISTIPFCFYYLSKTKKKAVLIFTGLFFMLIVLLSNGRSGAIIVTLELLLIAGILNPSMRQLVVITITPLIILSFALKEEKIEAYMNIIAMNIEPLSPRMASLLTGEGEGDLEMDKSWLIRKLMVDKGSEIFYKNPLFGVGPGNFSYYDAQLREFTQYNRLHGNDDAFYNTLSAHNSYVQALAELGLFGFFFVALIIVIPLLWFIRGLLANTLTAEHLPLVALLGISIHFYAISALTGALSWFIFGMAWAIKNK